MATSKKGLCKPKPTYTTASCGLCPKLDTDDMVACDKCDTWFHFECVGVTQKIENEDWLCKQCVKEAVKLADMVSSRGLRKSLPPSTAWSSTTSMSSKQKRIALMRLEEEQALKMEYINRKYQIMGCDDGSSDDEPNSVCSVCSLNTTSVFRKENHPDIVHPSVSDEEREQWNQMHFDESQRVVNSTVQWNKANKTFSVKSSSIGSRRSVQKPPMNHKKLPPLEPQYLPDTHQKYRVSYNRQANPTVGQTKSVQSPPTTKYPVYDNMVPKPNCSEFNPELDPTQIQHPRNLHSNYGVNFNQPQFPNVHQLEPFQQNVLDDRQIQSNNVPTVRRNTSGYVGYNGTLTQGHIASRHVFSKDLPQYWGKPESWPMFLSALTTSTNACGFSDAENLGRLQRCLKGDALELVESHLLHASSVPGVVETLHTMFGRPSIIIYNLLEKIEKTSAPKADDLNSLIKFGILVKNLSATIQSSGDLGQLRNPYLIQSITNKLPTQIALNWGSFIHGKDVDLAVMGDWLYNLAEVATGVINPLSLKISKRDQEFDSYHDDSSPSTYVNAHSDDSDCDKFKCQACNANTRHALENCKKFKEYSVEQRWDFIKKYRLCGSCFGSHKFHKCYRKRKCGAGGCTREHHILLHNTIESSSPKAIVQADNRSVVAYDDEGVKQMGSVNGGKDVVEQR